MKNKRKTIKGSQPTPTPTPIPIDPNDLAPECIFVEKVYDWVFFANKYENKNFIPDEECRAAVAAALAAGQRVDVRCSADVDDVQSSATILEHGNPGRVLIVWTVPVDVTILVNGASVCTFTVRTQFTDEIMLCVPTGITEDNIRLRAYQVICQTSGAVLMGPDPFGPMIPVRVVLCKDVQVHYPVKLEVLAKFCFPRPNNIPVPKPRIQCDLNLLEFPPQCPGLFPVANCECQATAITRGADTLADIGGVDVTGTSSIRAEICQECSLGDSTFTYSFTDTEFDGPTPTPTQPDYSFTFSPLTFNQPVCGEDSLTVSGTGNRDWDGDIERFVFDLTINDDATLDGESFRLILRDINTNAVVFDSGIVEAAVNFEECDTFADLLDNLDD
ncbi:MAG: hypothetical protein ACQEW2_09405 [Bacillota bacterium]|uniref:hypothetical protein n=1 Tax=Cytobacillus firmus TaxID=1399 RepID=UPI00077CBAC0|nr:hypothetical protein [Cytobacillus firmus]MDD9312428.1 hypothetical protein [Cytobacillus firmus]MEC1891901.1 hypothetical protein [Cytobacillus firmus]MED4448991.1 hypothetical protein [Cytobacillus firmus]MED4767937.1 hypothetical protein [Cytobacillus firmus]NUH83320.1 hypothetical protein [Cytobacillus firmus]